MLVKEVMKKPYVISENNTLKKSADLMEKHDVNSLIVLQGDKIIGIITHEDLVEHYEENKKVSQVMSKKIITINSDDKLDYASEIMKKNKISVLPVLDKGNLVGVIHVKDVLQGLSGGDDFLIN